MKPEVHTPRLRRLVFLHLKNALKDSAVGKFLREELYEMQNDWTNYTRDNVVEWLKDDHPWLANYLKRNNLYINRMFSDEHRDDFVTRKNIQTHNEISLLITE